MWLAADAPALDGLSRTPGDGPLSEDPRDHLARDQLARPYSDLKPIQRSVIDLIATAAPTCLHPVLLQDDRTMGQRLADKVAKI